MRTIKILITFGPASTPIDEVRRITNHSTGTLGTFLTEAYRKKGHEVIAVRGKGATAPSLSPYHSFDTNQDLLHFLLDLQKTFQPDLLLHAAALSDYMIDQVETPEFKGTSAPSKISSSHEHLTIHLKPAPKVLPQLRELFPKTMIVGWKYELEGKRSDALEKAQNQVRQGHSHLCVINGKAYGTGFGICNASQELRSNLTSEELPEALIQFLD